MRLVLVALLAILLVPAAAQAGTISSDGGGLDIDVTDSISAVTVRVTLTTAGTGGAPQYLVRYSGGVLDQIRDPGTGCTRISDKGGRGFRCQRTAGTSLLIQTSRFGDTVTFQVDAGALQFGPALEDKVGQRLDRLDRVIEESDAMIRVFNTMLLIARAESGAAREAMRVIAVSHGSA